MKSKNYQDKNFKDKSYIPPEENIRKELGRFQEKEIRRSVI